MARQAVAPTTPGDSSSLCELRGVVERITCQNPGNGDTVARVAEERPAYSADHSPPGVRQGAEFTVVVMPLLTTHAAMLGPTLLYTAFTRARRLVVIVGQWKALGLGVRDWLRSARHTALGHLLTGALRFSWSPGSPATSSAVDVETRPWEGLLEGATEG